jgi:hypothetical protein
VRGKIVKVYFLAGEYGDTGKGHRTQNILEMHLRKAQAATDLRNSAALTRIGPLALD